MSELAPLREAVETLADRAEAPDFRHLERRAVRRGRRRTALVAAATASVIAGSAAVLAGLDDDRTAPVDVPTIRPAPNGWVAVGAYQDGGDVYLTRPGQEPRRLQVSGSPAASEACPAWSPDGRKLMFGRVGGSAGPGIGGAELVIVTVDRTGAPGRPHVIPVDDFEVLDEQREAAGAHPCGTWAPDGRWVALAGAGKVWVVDTETDAIRRLSDMRPSDLEWRPGSDELTIAGDVGESFGEPTRSTPITVYSVSTGELRRLGSAEAALISWSPDGASLAYTGGEREPDSRELGLVHGDGTDERVLVDDMGPTIHGIGPVWSPTGDRIAYQRLEAPQFEASGERHEIVLVDVADGSESVIKRPRAGGHEWYPFTVSWSADGTTLLCLAWNGDGEPVPGGGQTLPEGAIAIPADAPGDAAVLVDSISVSNYAGYRWAGTQMWGRQPG